MIWIRSCKHLYIDHSIFTRVESNWHLNISQINQRVIQTLEHISVCFIKRLIKQLIKQNITKQNNIKSSNFTVFSLYDAYIGLSKECPIHKIRNYNLDFEYLAFYTFLNAQFCLKMAQNYTKYIANSPDLYRSAKINHILGEFPYLWKRVNIKTMAKILFMTKGVSSEYKSATNIT